MVWYGIVSYRMEYQRNDDDVGIDADDDAVNESDKEKNELNDYDCDVFK